MNVGEHNSREKDGNISPNVNKENAVLQKLTEKSGIIILISISDCYQPICDH